MHTTSSYLEECHGSESVQKALSNLDKVFKFDQPTEKSDYLRKTLYSLKEGGLLYCPGYNSSSVDIINILVSAVLQTIEMNNFNERGFEGKLSYIQTNMNLDVEKIEIIQHKKLNAMHNCFGKFAGARGTEYAAIHATTRKNADDIVQNGFKTILCRRSASGRGIYMANDFRICWTFGDACEENNYTTTLILSRIYLGKNLDVGSAGESVFKEGCITLTDKALSTVVLSDNYQALPFATVELSFHAERYKAKSSMRQYEWVTQYGSRLCESMGRLVYSLSKPQTICMLIEKRQDYFQHYSNKTNDTATTKFLTNFVEKENEETKKIVKFLMLRHVHVDLSMARNPSSTVQYEYYNSMKEMINQDMQDIFEKYNEVCGHGNMCIQGARHIEMKGANEISTTKSHKKTGAVVYFWDTRKLLLQDARSIQMTVINIQKRVSDDKRKITDEMRRCDKRIQRIWFPKDVVISAPTSLKRTRLNEREAIAKLQKT
jgi:hypothetical protein